MSSSSTKAESSRTEWRKRCCVSVGSTVSSRSSAAVFTGTGASRIVVTSLDMRRDIQDISVETAVSTSLNGLRRSFTVIGALGSEPVIDRRVKCFCCWTSPTASTVDRSFIHLELIAAGAAASTEVFSGDRGGEDVLRRSVRNVFGKGPVSSDTTTTSGGGSCCSCFSSSPCCWC